MPIIDDAELPIGGPSDSWRPKAQEGAMQVLAERNAELASQNAKMREVIIDLRARLNDATGEKQARINSGMC